MVVAVSTQMLCHSGYMNNYLIDVVTSHINTLMSLFWWCLTLSLQTITLARLMSPFHVLLYLSQMWCLGKAVWCMTIPDVMHHHLQSKSCQWDQEKLCATSPSSIPTRTTWTQLIWGTWWVGHKDIEGTFFDPIPSITLISSSLHLKRPSKLST